MFFRLLTSFAALLLVGACTPAASRTPNVVLVVIDTLRVDRLSAYGCTIPTSPNLEALANEGAIFTDAWSPAPWTVPSVASILTGLHPISHGAGKLGKSPTHLDTTTPTGLAAGVQTLAERLQALGYQCDAFVTNPYVRDLLSSFRERVIRVEDGSDVADFTTSRLRSHSDVPRFLYAHFMECHDPILAPDEDLMAVSREHEPRRIPEFWARTLDSSAFPDRERFRRERLHAYDGSIHYVDRQIGKIARAAAESANRRPTILVITSDHGEEILDHADVPRFDPRGLQGIGHGHTLFAELLRVPLVLVGAGIPASRISDPVSLVDIAPTILDLVGRPVPQEMDGRSLLPAIRGQRLEPRGQLGGSIAYGYAKGSWTDLRWHFIESESDAEPAMLFDRSADPTQRTNLAREFPGIVEAIRADMQRAKNTMTVREGRIVELGIGDAERLQSIGYIGGR